MHRVTYAKDGTTLVQDESRSVIETALATSLAGVKHKRADERDQNNYTVVDAFNRALYHVSGPPPEADKPADPTKTAGEKSSTNGTDDETADVGR